MKTSINNFRGCLSAEFETDKRPVFILGDNGQGKTSIALALTAIHTGNTIPTDLITKSDSAKIITDGRKNGRIRQESDAFCAEINYPEAVLQTSGEPPSASPIACGTDSILFMNQKNRGTVISKYLNAEPTEADLMEEFEKEELTFIPKVWETIQGLGWDSAHKKAENTGTELKGRWKQISQESYGAKKIQHWLPKGWDFSLEKLTEKDLLTEVDDKQGWVESAIAAEAVGDSRIEDMENAIDSASKMLDTPEGLEDLINKFEENKKILQEKIDAEPAYANSNIMGCPKCNTKLLIAGGELVQVPGNLTKDHIDIINERVNKNILSIAEADAEIPKIRQRIKGIETERVRIAGMKKDLEKLKTDKADPSEKPLAACRADLVTSQERLKMIQDKAAADKISKSLVINQKIVKILAPAGLRRTKILACLKEFNSKLLAITKKAGWLAVTVAENYSVFYNKRFCGINTEKSLCSASEWFKAKTVLQFALAVIDKSAVILVDGAEILMNEGRKGLIRISDNKVVAFISMNNQEEVKPKLREIVNCYWIENGELVSL